jgi:hypothetical protein
MIQVLYLIFNQCTFALISQLNLKIPNFFEMSRFFPISSDPGPKVKYPEKSLETVIIKSVTDGWTDGWGWTDGEPDGHHHTIICPIFNGRIIKINANMCFIKSFKILWVILS